ncbi:MAG: cysteine--tRNA ligase [Pseudomonadota bacterium]
MKLTLHDTLAREKRVFEPLKPGKVTMYLCGPTVYNYAHIGNARPAVVFDVLARLLRRHFDLTFARNLTDVDDKINQASIETGLPIDAITAKFITAYNDDMAGLGVAPPDIEPRATDHIDQMIEMIERLIAAGNAYAAEGHVLFDVTSYDDYGRLSRRNTDEMLAGARVEVAPYKRSPGDFVLWKPSSPELPGWDSPWGRGRPGWHLECSAMCLNHLGPVIDIHCGGADLVFPHHENEVAQSCCANGTEALARYWLHNGYLNIDNTKMSKSLGNVFLVRELLAEHPGEVLRLALLSAHYRQPLDWSGSLLADSKRKLDRLYGALRHAGELAGEDAPSEAVVAALADDINTPGALAALFDLARDINRTEDPAERAKQGQRLQASGALLGLLSQSPDAWFGHTDSAAGELAGETIEARLAERQQAKADKDYARADAIRTELERAGIIIEDTPAGARWRRH